MRDRPEVWWRDSSVRYRVARVRYRVVAARWSAGY